MKTTANKIPTTTSSSIGLSDQSYLHLLPFSSPDQAAAADATVDSDEPDVREDDVTVRNLRDLNTSRLPEVQPKFGIPLGPVSGGAASDYLHAVPSGKYRSTFHAMRTPDMVRDDLAWRGLRKDDNVSDPDLLGIVRDPHGLMMPRRVWAYREPRSSPLRIIAPHTKASRSLSEGITEVIKRQSANPSAENTIVSYHDVVDAKYHEYESVLLDKSSSNKKKKKASKRRSASLGRTVFEILKNGGGSSSSDSEESESEKQKSELLKPAENSPPVTTVSSPDKSTVVNFSADSQQNNHVVEDLSLQDTSDIIDNRGDDEDDELDKDENEKNETIVKDEFAPSLRISENEEFVIDASKATINAEVVPLEASADKNLTENHRLHHEEAPVTETDDDENLLGDVRSLREALSGLRHALCDQKSAKPKESEAEVGEGGATMAEDSATVAKNDDLEAEADFARAIALSEQVENDLKITNESARLDEHSSGQPKNTQE